MAPKFEKENGLTNEEEVIFGKALAIAKLYEAGNAIDHNLDDVNAVAHCWDLASKYQTELALDIVLANRNEKLQIVLPYSIMAHAYDSVTYRELLTETLSSKSRQMAMEQAETHEHELPFELLTFMTENQITDKIS